MEMDTNSPLIYCGKWAKVTNGPVISNYRPTVINGPFIVAYRPANINTNGPVTSHCSK